MFGGGGDQQRRARLGAGGKVGARSYYFFLYFQEFSDTENCGKCQLYSPDNLVTHGHRVNVHGAWAPDCLVTLVNGCFGATYLRS